MRLSHIKKIDSAKKDLFRSGDPDFMTSLARGLEVMGTLSQSDSELKMPEISKQTNLSRAVVRRCLYTLQELGYVESKPLGFRLLPKVLSLGQSYYGAKALPQIAQPFLEQVHLETGESCSLAILDGSEVIYIARSTSRRIMNVSLNIGSRLPAFCTSLGRALLAHLSPKELQNHLSKEKYRPLTANTITTISELTKAINQVAKDGYALVDQELEVGLRSLSVPVINQQGSVIAAMNVGVSASRISNARMLQNILPVLRNAGKLLGEQTSL
ncbi:helix-turn-helix domain-containing protein [Akkermansiaceae bacterium]|nr:helix-turn-helix domain-containing protein [Akkermansiaceae bacterium]MDA7508564.1 helix-turn-helix domain-containing protein [Akkermansiaceae bacterium]MDA7521877.1 helix-turn-helix domain-containing protein [Akkermansiaceae bacterium]MDA8974815.1 helix-turn-helix domain-containing protein [Akkermansiaceae bacterium]